MLWKNSRVSAGIVVNKQFTNPNALLPEGRTKFINDGMVMRKVYMSGEIKKSVNDILLAGSLYISEIKWNLKNNAKGVVIWVFT